MAGKINIKKVDQIDQDQWNIRAKSIPEGTIWQTTHIIPVMQVFQYEPIFLIARDEERKVVGQLLMFSGSPCPNFLLGAPYKSVTLHLSKKLFRTYNWYYGPLIFDRIRFKKILDEFLSYLNQLSLQGSGFFVKDVIPPIHNRQLDQELTRTIYEKYGFQAKKVATITVDLTQDSDFLWADLKKTSRYDVKKAMRDGAEVVDANGSEGAREYYKLRVEAAKRGRLEKPVDYANAAFKNLKPAGMYNLFLAKHKKQLIAGIGSYKFNGIVMQCGLANSNYAIEHKIFAMHLITWKMIKWAKEKGYRTFDLIGFNPNQAERSEKEEGIFRFKNRWGGEIIKYYSYSRSYSKTKDKIYKFIKNFK